MVSFDEKPVFGWYFFSRSASFSTNLCHFIKVISIFNDFFFTFYFRREKWVFPICYVLLSTKTRSTYEGMFNLLKNVWPRFEPERFTVDFEEAVIGAIRSIFGNVEINGCLFHLMQNFHRKIASLGPDENGQSILQVFYNIFIGIDKQII